MSKKVLVLSASSRKGGNSDLLCDRFMLGANEAGNQTEKIFFRDKKIGIAWPATPAKTTAENACRTMTWRRFWRR